MTVVTCDARDWYPYRENVIIANVDGCFNYKNLLFFVSAVCIYICNVIDNQSCVGIFAFDLSSLF